MAKRKPADDDEPQKVVLEDVGPKAREAHNKAFKSSIMNEKVLIAFFGAIVACTTCLQMWMQYRRDEAQKERDARVAVKVDEAAVKVAEAAVKAETVKQTLDSTTKITDEKLNKLSETTEATHVLVNSGSLVQMRLLADVSRWKADQTGKPADIKAAELAEKNVKEHEEKQKKVDDSQ